MRVLLLSAYDAASHRQWRECLQRELPEWQWTVLSQPPRHFSWRIRGNPLSWALQQRNVLEAGHDLVLATSMVDLATLRGLVPALGDIPAVLYFHENQFAYPEGRGRHGLLEAQMVSLYSSLAAGLLLFNSDYNRRSFLQGCSGMLDRFPDGVPADTMSLLDAKCRVLPVPVDPVSPAGGRPAGDALQILWNHRWEYDKGPRALLDIAAGLLRREVKFCLHVAGQQFREQPAEFNALKQMLEPSGADGQWGYLENPQEYTALMQRCDVVLSTALHDFQGLSMLEACGAGCFPLAPDRLVYPEWFPATCLYGRTDEVLDQLEALARQKANGQQLQPVDVSRFETRHLIPSYRELLHSQVLHKSVS